MSPSLRKVGAPVAVGLTGAIIGGLGTAVTMPLIRQADPLGLSPVVLISVMGGMALGWYLRGRAEPGAAPDPAGT